MLEAKDFEEVVALFIIESNINIIDVIMSILAWCSIGLLAYRINKKQPVRLKVWKIVIVIWVGLCSFSINWNLFDTQIKFSILPLGVWILYLFLKRNKERWEKYRSYAWLGFWGNYIFLVATLISIPVYDVVFSESDPSTYISNVEKASIIKIHPSAHDLSLNKERLLNQLSTLKKDSVYTEEWYHEVFVESDLNNREERFPYQLIGTSPKWGSGLETAIYIEADGRGLLISTFKNQLYFRSDDSMLVKGE